MGFYNFRKFKSLEKYVNEIDPVCILDDRSLFGDFTTLSNEEYLQLNNIYLTIPDRILNTISEVIEIGAGNLYGGTGVHSDITLAALMAVINYCSELNTVA